MALWEGLRRRRGLSPDVVGFRSYIGAEHPAPFFLKNFKYLGAPPDAAGTPRPSQCVASVSPYAVQEQVYVCIPPLYRVHCTEAISVYSTSHGGHEDKNCAFDLQVLCNHHGVGSLVLRVVLVWPSSSVARPNRGAHAAQGRDLDLRERRHGPDRPPKHRTASARRRVDRWAST